MTRLPKPGSDDGTWGDILNAYLDVSHASDGSLKSSVVGSNQIQTNAINNTHLGSAVKDSLTRADNAIQSVNGKSGSSVNLAASDISAIPTSQLGANDGVAQLDSGGSLKSSQLPGSVVSVSQVSLAPAPTGVAATDTANLQATIALGKSVQLQPGSYQLSAPLAPAVNGQKLVGFGMDVTVLQSSVSDVLHVGTASTHFGVVADLTLKSLAGGGHCLAPQMNAGRWRFRGVRFLQFNAAQSCVYHDQNTTGLNIGLIDWEFQDCSFEVAQAASVPAVMIRGAAGNANNIRFRDCWVQSANQGTQYSIWIEGTGGSSYQYQVDFDKVIFEEPVAGALMLLSVFQADIDISINDGQSSPGGLINSDVIYVGKSPGYSSPLLAAGLPSEWVRVKRYLRASSPLNTGIMDLRLQSGGVSRVIIEDSDVATLSGLEVDAGSNNGVIVLHQTPSMTINNLSAIATGFTSNLESIIVRGPASFAKAVTLSAPLTIGSSTEAAAANGSVFIDTDDGSNFGYKDASGVMHRLGRGLASPLRPTTLSAQFETFDRRGAVFSASSLNLGTAGKLVVAAFWLPRGVTIHGMTAYAGTSLVIGANNDAHQWFALCDGSRNVHAITADDLNNAWSGGKNLAFTAPYLVLGEGIFYGVVYCHPGTGAGAAAPNLVNVASGTTVVNNEPSLLCGTADTLGQVGPGSCPATLAAFTAGTNYPYLWLY